MNGPVTLLVDADIVAYKAAAVTEGCWYFNGRDEPPCVSPQPDLATEIARRYVEDAAKACAADHVIVCLTDAENFRYGVFPAYKSNRIGLRRPETLKTVKAWLAEQYQTYQRPGLEADDCMGILSTHKALVPGKKIIVSEDKDMQSIPGWLFNPAKDKKPRRITRIMADRYFAQQTITGDPTDGYPGCPGVGPRSRFVLSLPSCRSMAACWAVVLDAYASKGLTEAEALVQARCARILRSSEWDFKAHKPILWNPPQA